jgi:hypothetical protein
MTLLSSSTPIYRSLWTQPPLELFTKSLSLDTEGEGPTLLSGFVIGLISPQTCTGPCALRLVS